MRWTYEVFLGLYFSYFKQILDYINEDDVIYNLQNKMYL